MKKQIKKNINNHKKFLVFNINSILILVFALAFTSISYASNVIYTNQNKYETTVEDNKDIFKNPYLETTELEPYAETYEEPIGVRVAENLKRFGELSSHNSKAIIRIEDFEDQPKTADYIKYIKHTQSITIVPEGSYIWSKVGKAGRWTMSIFDQNVQRQAQNGFYKVDGKTYYFDEDGYMYIGKMMDERDTIYIFSESGEMIYKNPA